MPPEELKKEQRRDNLKKGYDITPEDYDRLLVEQEGLCAICGQPPTEGRGHRLHVDHCHNEGLVRGLLCRACNTGLGAFKDNPRLLNVAAAYIEVIGDV